MRNAPFVLILSFSALLASCGDPKPPPQARQISPDAMAAQINALDVAQKQNEAAAYQYYQSQQVGSRAMNVPKRR